ncbi:class I SAM-dependent methyltransferase [Aeromonas allosaccharophila]|uniref:class I SAM-dependent methyltransferase n=1 Tax=Aeromonas allosaccharophila TaxID=656 RepID=UPI0013C70596|nr:class I SAM-dependent methyltransferase [Aeromonas allosaccharophila]WDO03845.1 class I SAM-dependent methyltransferase [Aeromonas allosaccharophila]
MMSSKSKQFIKEHVYDDSLINFGLRNEKYLNAVIDALSDFDNDLNGRWRELEHFGDADGCILDMAAGVGSFVFRGLNRGYNVYGVEPEKWKLEYIQMRIEEEPKYFGFRDRVKYGLGEKLDFKDHMFDVVCTYQTLEHVQDVAACIDELIRVTKPGGKILIQAPDYCGFFEPHYLLPLLPNFNLAITKFFLRFLNRPSTGLKSINWITSNEIISYIGENYPGLKIINVRENHHNKNVKSAMMKYHLPEFFIRSCLNFCKWIKSLRHCEDMYLVIRKL